MFESGGGEPDDPSINRRWGGCPHDTRSASMRVALLGTPESYTDTGIIPQISCHLLRGFGLYSSTTMVSVFDARVSCKSLTGL